MTSKTITASNARHSDCCDTEGALDLDVSVMLPDGTVLSGEVTLVPARSHSGYVSWGEPSHWVSSDLLAGVQSAAEAIDSKYDTDVEFESILHSIACEAGLVADQFDAGDPTREEGDVG